MNVRELISELLKYDMESSCEVCIELAHEKSIDIYHVSIGRHNGQKVLLIEPDEDVVTLKDAEDTFLVKEPK